MSADKPDPRDLTLAQLLWALGEAVHLLQKDDKPKTAAIVEEAMWRLKRDHRPARRAAKP